MVGERDVSLWVGCTTHLPLRAGARLRGGRRPTRHCPMSTGDPWIDGDDVQVVMVPDGNGVDCGGGAAPQQPNTHRRDGPGSNLNPLTKRLQRAGGGGTADDDDDAEAATPSAADLLRALGLGTGDAALNDILAVLREAAEKAGKAGGGLRPDNAERDAATAATTAPAAAAGGVQPPDGGTAAKAVAVAASAAAGACSDRVYDDFNKTLEDAILTHYKAWMANVRNKASRAIDWVLQSMLDDAARGNVTLQYDIPPGQEDFLHDTFPEWMSEERGVEVLRVVVQEELLLKGFRAPTESLEKKVHGENGDRYYFRLTYTVPAPSEIAPEMSVQKK